MLKVCEVCLKEGCVRLRRICGSGSSHVANGTWEKGSLGEIGDFLPAKLFPLYCFKICVFASLKARKCFFPIASPV